MKVGHLTYVGGFTALLYVRIPLTHTSNEAMPSPAVAWCTRVLVIGTNSSSRPKASHCMKHEMHLYSSRLNINAIRLSPSLPLLLPLPRLFPL